MFFDQFSTVNSDKKNLSFLVNTKLFFSLNFTVFEVITDIIDRAVNLLEYLKTRFNYEKDNLLKIIPEIVKCPSCEQNLSMMKLKKNGVFLGSLALMTDVFVKKCDTESCNQFGVILHFQGTEKGIMNFNNKFFVSVEIIKEYFDLYSKNGTPFSPYIKIKLDMTKLAQKNNPQHLPLADVESLTSYIGALHEGFCESIGLFLYDKKDFFCCKSPKIVQTDGIVLSIKTSRMPDFKVPWLDKKIMKRATNRKDRQLDPLNTEEFDIVWRIINSDEKKCTTIEKQKLEKSVHIGARVMAICLIKAKEMYKLYQGTDMFAKTLIKKVASASSLLPQSCVHILQK